MTLTQFKAQLAAQFPEDEPELPEETTWTQLGRLTKPIILPEPSKIHKHLMHERDSDER